MELRALFEPNCDILDSEQRPLPFLVISLSVLKRNMAWCLATLENNFTCWRLIRVVGLWQTERTQRHGDNVCYIV